LASEEEEVEEEEGAWVWRRAAAGKLGQRGDA